jgi:hypothetical protein
LSNISIESPKTLGHESVIRQTTKEEAQGILLNVNGEAASFNSGGHSIENQVTTRLLSPESAY